MAKEKKITVKFYPVLIKSDKNNDYRIYCSLTYNRVTTKFPMQHAYPGTLEEVEIFIEKELDKSVVNATDSGERGVLSWRKRLIKAIVRKEIEVIGDNYSVLGFNERFPKFEQRIQWYLCGNIYLSMFEKLEDVLTFKKYSQLALNINSRMLHHQFFNIFETIEDLADNYNIDVKNVLGNDFYFQLTVIGYLAVFELVEKAINPDTFIQYDKISPQIAQITIGEWASDLDAIKQRIFKFIKSNQPKLLLNTYSKGKYSEIAVKYGFDDAQIDSFLANQFLYREIERKYLKWGLTLL